MTTLNLSVLASADDGSAHNDDSSLDYASTDLQVVPYNVVANTYSVLLRFQNVTIPKGAIITPGLSYVSLNSYPGDSNTYCTIYGNNVDDASDLASLGYIVTVAQRPRTTASTSWIGACVGGWNNSPDISAIIQEIINRAGWVSGNDIAILLIAPTEWVGGQYGNNFRSYDEGTPPTMQIVYTVPTNIPYSNPYRSLLAQ